VQLHNGAHHFIVCGASQCRRVTHVFVGGYASKGEYFVPDIGVFANHLRKLKIVSLTL